MNIVKLEQYQFDEINKRLADKYGKFENGFPYFRLIWSEDVMERRRMTHTDEGFELINPEVRMVPKYRHYIRDRYILEGLTAVPEFVETDLVEKISYEPVWTFETGTGQYIIPIWEAVYFILETVKHNQENAGKPREYQGKILGDNEDLGKEEQLHNKLTKVNELEKELFGNETSVGDALSHRSGVGFGPGSSPNSTIIKKDG